MRRTIHCRYHGTDNEVEPDIVGKLCEECGKAIFSPEVEKKLEQSDFKSTIRGPLVDFWKTTRPVESATSTSSKSTFTCWNALRIHEVMSQV
jgi:hypothetical protein